ncbi:O-antigen/teichoic acid export membrane protein [Anaerotaenia torta]|uniref:lipopolysaccharide biosynthesis protein n=1 Tax=Anaerotaenia torta TaxID=433293 RepID=UPI003D227B35
MASRSKVLKAGMGYSIGNMLIRGIAFISTPIFTRVLTTNDYGLYSTFVSYESILAMVIGLCLHSSIKSANIEYPGKLDDYASAVCSFQVVLLVVSIAIWGISGAVGFDPLEIGKVPALLMIINGFASSIILVYNSYLSISYEYKKYLTLSFISSFGNIIFSLLLIFTIFKNQRYVGRIAGTAVAAALVGFIVLKMLFSKRRPRLTKDYIKFGISYSLPIIPHGLSQVILAQFGKIIVQRVVGNSEAGIFGFAYTIALIPQVLGTSLDTAWGPWFYENFKRDNEVVKKRALQYLLLFSILIIGINTFSAEAVYILGSKAYWDAIYIVPSAVLSMYFLFLYYFPSSIEYYEKKTKFIALGSMLAALLNIALNYVCVRKFGYEAASYVTLATYVVYFLLHVFIAGRLSKFPFDIAKMSSVILITCGVTALDIIFIKNILIRIAILLLVSALLYFMNRTTIMEAVQMLSIKPKGKKAEERET